MRPHRSVEEILRLGLPGRPVVFRFRTRTGIGPAENEIPSRQAHTWRPPPLVGTPPPGPMAGCAELRVPCRFLPDPAFSYLDPWKDTSALGPSATARVRSSNTDADHPRGAVPENPRSRFSASGRPALIGRSFWHPSCSKVEESALKERHRLWAHRCPLRASVPIPWLTASGR